MKLPFANLIGPVTALALLTTAHGAGYITNFDPPAFVGGASLSGQELWDTNNYSPGPDMIPGTADDLGQSDFVGIISGYSTTMSDHWALLGGGAGIAPVVNTSYLFRPVDPEGATAAAFNVRFGISSSQTPRGNKDTFGWTFRDSTGAQLLRVGFIPATNQANNLTVRVYDAANNELPGSGAVNIFNNSIYDLSLGISSTSTVSLSLKDGLGNTTQIINNQVAAGAIPSALSDVAATWSLFDTTTSPNGERPNYGSNSLLFDNYSLAFVPEPATTLFGLALGVFGIAARRRQRSC